MKKIELSSQCLSNQLIILQQLHPVKGWVYVGAGNGGLFQNEYFRHVDRLIAVEADRHLHAELVVQIDLHPGWKAIHATVGEDESETTYYRYNNSKENGLVSPEVLSLIWKNLRLKEKQTIRTCSLNSLLEREDFDGNCNWLTLDCLPALPLLRGLGVALEGFDVIQVREAVFDCGSLEQSEAGGKSVGEWLRKQGFIPLFNQEENHSKLRSVIYLRKWKEKAAENIKFLIAEHSEKIDVLTRQIDSLKVSCEKLTQEKMALQAENDAMANQKIDEFANLVSRQSEVLIDSAQKSLQAISGLKKFVGGQMKKEVANGVRQIGSFFNLQRYMTDGIFSDVDIEINSWPASSDFLYYITKRLDVNCYDFIIELGSGTTTVVIAKSIAWQQTRANGKLKPCFISFDHLEKYWKNTGSRLQDTGLSEWVELIHAPLVDYISPSGCVYKYYDFHGATKIIDKNNNDKPKKILVIVDGPPESTGKNARYPIGPILIDTFKSAQIEILLDDAARPDEKNTIELWKQDFILAGYSVQEELIELEKGAALLTLSPRC